MVTAPETASARGGSEASPALSAALAGDERGTIGAQQIVIEHVSPTRAAIRRFLRHRLAIVGVFLVIAIVLMAILAPLLTPWAPNRIDFLTGARQPPSATHVLGTDVAGRDIWARVLYGGRTSTIVGFGAVALYLVIGTILGLIAGFYGGLLDQAIMRFTDTILSIPPLLLIVVFVSVVGPSIGSVILVIALLGWPVTCRLVRGQLLVLREVEYITAARVVGVSDRGILFRHMLPNILGPVTVVATFGVATAVLLESSLSFLGLGVRPPEASWGNLITEAISPVVLNHLPWQWVPAAIGITATVLGVNFIGDGLRDAIDPRTVRRG
ncbi:MAG TPA: ABC transporter permease [Candidatus Limnocylindrales bacterium]|jgi:peptide/nickel transport system permease protein|nr:ABC transporter permease [Candidatus Limnocylindrales bacterium]